MSRASEMEFKRQRHAAGLCVQCGAKMPEGDTRVYCRRCREMSDALRKKRAAEGRCVRCGVELPDGYKLRKCPACNERILRMQRDRYRQRSAAGMCVVCGKAPAADGTSMCAGCLSRFRAWKGCRPRAVYVAEKPGEEPVVGSVREIAETLHVSSSVVYRMIRGLRSGMAEGWTISRRED